YELTGNEKGKQIATYFWNEVVAQHTYAIGSNSDHEHFFEPGKIAAHLTGYTGETCNTYNMLKITRHLFCWYAKALYADYYEQALYNHILGQQDPATGMVCYFTPMLSGAYRLYSTYDRSFWCCVGSGFESHSKYAEAIYYHDGKGIYINLFIPSVLTWKEKGITLTQETKFPETDTTRFTVGSDAPVDVPLYIRYPSWVKDGAEIKINGRNIKLRNEPGSYIVLNRKWKNGDKIEVIYPMSLRLVKAPGDSTKAAVAYGPVVLAGKMGTQDMPAPFHDPADPYEYYNYDYKVPATLVHSLDPEQISPVNGSPLTFTAKGITLVPYYNLHHERYVVYWDLEKATAQAQHKYDFTPVEKKVQGWIDSSYYPGAGVIIAKDNTVIYEHYFGNYQPGTVVYIASAGKWLAAAAIAAVVDEGKLSWNDKVKKWLPEFKDGKGDATLAQLLSHTAGYPDYQPADRRPDNYQSLKESVAHIVSLPADTTPGAVFHYGGLAMQVAGRMAELATGKQWETIFQEKIAIPLGMKNTHFTPVDETPGHNPMIGGGARCTLKDYAAFLSMISGDGVYQGKRVLSEQAVKVMQADHTGKAYVKYGEFVHKIRHTNRNDIYGLGEWREEVNTKNEAVLISSPGWAGAYPWIDKTNNTYGFILARVNTGNTGKTGFSSFYAGSQLPVMVRQILEF
ncbi:MAG TPA: beta-L-arabinofuranosidase domain-containing protein, partial [Chitinophaga sp.]|nr:beta-L-arabinofuranosidase domain-containing protein [Chitinophaga sp.]